MLITKFQTYTLNNKNQIGRGTKPYAYKYPGTRIDTNGDNLKEIKCRIDKIDKIL